MTRNSDAIEGLRTAVELIRARDFSNVDSEIVNEILDVQLTFAELRGEGHKLTDQVVTRHIAADSSPSRENEA